MPVTGGGGAAALIGPLAAPGAALPLAETSRPEIERGSLFVSFFFFLRGRIQTNDGTDRRTERQTDKRSHRKTDTENTSTQTHRKTDRKTERQTEEQTEGQTGCLYKKDMLYAKETDKDTI